MVTFLPDASKALVANEGGPDDGIDPLGSVSIIALSSGVENATVNIIDFTSFDSQQQNLVASGVRIFPGQVLSQDVEPEYIVVSEDGATAYVSLQENNAVAVVDIATAAVTEIQPLGLKDYNTADSGLDPSDRNGGINIGPQPVLGLYMHDAIATFTANGTTYKRHQRLLSNLYQDKPSPTILRLGMVSFRHQE